MQDTVRAHIADIEATRDAGLDAANTHAQDLVESHAEIADLTKSIHKLQAKYARMAIEGADGSGGGSGGASDAANKLVQKIRSHSHDDGDGAGDGRPPSLRQALGQAAIHGSVANGEASATSLRGGPVIVPGVVNDASANHGPGGKGHLIPSSSGLVDPGDAARAAANANPTTRATQAS